jgi:hypothetical protein
MAHEKTRILSGTGAITGSIVAIANGNTGIIDHITFGKYIEGGTDIVVQDYATNLPLQNSADGDGDYVGSGRIEGPIRSVKLASGTAIIYYNGNLA